MHLRILKKLIPGGHFSLIHSQMQLSCIRVVIVLTYSGKHLSWFRVFLHFTHISQYLQRWHHHVRLGSRKCICLSYHCEVLQHIYVSLQTELLLRYFILSFKIRLLHLWLRNMCVKLMNFHRQCRKKIWPGPTVCFLFKLQFILKRLNTWYIGLSYTQETQFPLKILHSKTIQLWRNWHERYNLIVYFNVKKCYTFLNLCNTFLILCSQLHRYTS